MNLKSIIFALLVTLLPNHQAWSQSEQQDETQLPIEVEADRLHAEDQAGLTVYQGHVIAKQGSLTLKGDKIEIRHPNRQLERMTTTGQPAYFERYLSEQQAWVKGHADTLIYYTQPRRVELIGSAYLEQENQHKIQGDKLVYDLDQQTLNAISDQSDSRIKMIITPQKDESESK
jgi:lipopolysaccharide export system protein LptA